MIQVYHASTGEKISTGVPRPVSVKGMRGWLAYGIKGTFHFSDGDSIGRVSLGLRDEASIRGLNLVNLVVWTR